MLRNIFICLLSFVAPHLQAQYTISGRIMDEETNEPLPYVYIYTPDNSNTTESDFNGNYTLNVSKQYDSIKCSSTGYNEVTKKLNGDKNQIVNFYLKQEANTMKKFIVRKGVNPAIRIIKGAQKNKHKYNYNKLSAYQYSSYSKVTLAANNISEKLKKRKFVKKVGSLFDTIAYLSEDSKKSVLPVFMSENISEFYFKKNPRREKEIILASKIKGVGVQDGTLLSQLLGSTFQQYNFYDNHVPILKKSFISPISDLSLSFYKYKIKDVKVNANGLNTYEIKVKPKNPLDLAFTGTIWIEDSTFALKKLVLSIPEKANLNYIEHLKVSMELARLPNGVYFPSKKRILIDVDEVSKNSAGMVAIFSASFKNVIANKPKIKKFYDYPVSVNEDAYLKDDDYWTKKRHNKLSYSEKKVISKIDSLTNIRLIKNYVSALDILINGYKKVGKVDIGQWTRFIGYNKLEGFKSQIAVRTNYNFSKHWVLDGRLGYGFKDKIWKYNFKTKYILSRKKWTVIGYEHNKMIQQIGLQPVPFGRFNLFNDFSEITNNQLYRERANKIWFQTEPIKGIQFRIDGMNSRQKHYKINDFNFVYLKNRNDTMSKSRLLNISELSGTVRYAHNEFYVQNDNKRMPVRKRSNYSIAATYSRGFKDIFRGNFNYDRVRLKMDFYQQMGTMGFSIMEFEGLKTFGNVPYPLLNLHRGNETFMYSRLNYNQMNFLEFVSNQSASLWWEHHFEGLFLNRIPLIKKLKWRSFVGGKILAGALSKQSRILIPRYDTGGDKVTHVGSLHKKPYVEVGYGIENIFKIIKVDFVHRLTYLKMPYKIQPFGIYGSLSFRF